MHNPSIRNIRLVHRMREMSVSICMYHVRSRILLLGPHVTESPPLHGSPHTIDASHQVRIRRRHPTHEVATTISKLVYPRRYSECLPVSRVRAQVHPADPSRAATKPDLSIKLSQPITRHND